MAALDSWPKCSTYVHVTVETLGDAHKANWRVLARCAGLGRIDGAHKRSSRECTYRHELDMESLVWTLPGVREVRTYAVIDEVKNTTRIPL